MCDRIQIQRTKGWRLPAGAVIVDRRTKWGNRFRYRTREALARTPAIDGSTWEYEDRISSDGAIHDYHHADGHVTSHYIRYMTIVECVELYERCLVNPTPQLHLWQGSGKPWLTVVDVRRELTWKDLACWCPVGAVCHADVLLRLANPRGFPMTRCTASPQLTMEPPGGGVQTRPEPSGG
jgi:hypothetical protein